MFSDARRSGLVDGNPFAGLRLRGSHGRKDLDVLSLDEVERLAACAGEVWAGEVALTVRALVLMAAFVGMRPAELYGLRWLLEARREADAVPVSAPDLELTQAGLVGRSAPMIVVYKLIAQAAR